MSPFHLSRRGLLQSAFAIGGAAAFGIGASTPAPARQSHPISDLFRYAPMFQPDPESRSPVIATFADLDRQTEATGSTRPEIGASTDDQLDWWLALYALGMPRGTMENFRSPIWKEQLGFDFTQVWQTVQVGLGSTNLSFYTGIFDGAAMAAAWQGAGYERIESGGYEIYSLDSEEKIDLAHPVQRVVLAAFNNLTLIGDDLLIASSRLDQLEHTLAVIDGEAPSLADEPAIALLLPVAEQCVTGSIFARTDDPATAVIGITPGGPVFNTEQATPETAQVQLALLYGDAEAAENASALISTELDHGQSALTGRPWAELFAGFEIIPTPNGVTTITIDLVQPANPAIWRNLLDNDDLGFIVG